MCNECTYCAETYVRNVHRKMSDRESVTHDCADCVRTWDEKEDLFLLIPTLYKTCFSKRCNICSIVLASFQIFQERKQLFIPLSRSLLSLLNRRRCWVVAFDFHHTLSGWPEGPWVTYLYYTRFVSHSQNSHMLVSKATNQDPLSREGWQTLNGGALKQSPLSQNTIRLFL